MDFLSFLLVVTHFSYRLLLAV
ncbi:hypothetical protein PI27_gp022 [Listeria phage WIL-1]|nr:hypothetical protein PI27_gp022 [Listeria phage WIL-1]